MDGQVLDVHPNNDKSFTYKELQHLISGIIPSPATFQDIGRVMIEIVPLPSGKSIVVNEEGKLIGLEKNENATEYWKTEYPITQYPHNNDELIVGDALVVDRSEID